MHKLINQYYQGHGKWKQCKDCGGTRHSGYWWLAGYKSKMEPPCPITFKEIGYVEWTESADHVPMEITFDTD